MPQPCSSTPSSSFYLLGVWAIFYYLKKLFPGLKKKKKKPADNHRFPLPVPCAESTVLSRWSLQAMGSKRSSSHGPHQRDYVPRSEHQQRISFFNCWFFSALKELLVSFLYLFLFSLKKREQAKFAAITRGSGF